MTYFSNLKGIFLLYQGIQKTLDIKRSDQGYNRISKFPQNAMNRCDVTPHVFVQK